MAKLHFNNLPHDTLIRVISYLDPIAIINLRKTCKKLSSQTRERIVWIEALRQRSYAQRTLFSLASLASTTQPDLEAMVTSYYRFAARLHQTGPESTDLPPVNTRTLVLADPTKNFSAVTMAPGGCFLVVIVDNDLLQLWDIRGSDTPSHPLVSFDPGPESLVTVISALDPSLERINLLCGIIPFSGDEDTHDLFFRVYTIQPFAKAPCFEKVADLHFNGLCHFYYLDDVAACAVIFSTGFVTIWNFRENTACTIGVPTDEMDFPAVEICIFDDLFLIWSKGIVHMYKLPPFEPLDGPVQPPSVLHKPAYSFRCSVASTVAAFFYDVDDHTLFFDALGSDDTVQKTDITGDKMEFICSYECKNAPGRALEDLITCAGFTVNGSHFYGDTPDPDLHVGYTFVPKVDSGCIPLRAFSLVLPFRMRTMLWLGSTCVYLKPLLAEEDGGRPSLTLWKCEKGDYVNAEMMSFCPYSARVCVGKQTEDDSGEGMLGKEIKVLDFV